MKILNNLIVMFLVFFGLVTYSYAGKSWSNSGTNQQTQTIQSKLNTVPSIDSPTFTTKITSPEYDSNSPDGSHMANIGNGVAYNGIRAKGTIFHNISTMYYCETDNNCKRIGTGNINSANGSNWGSITGDISVQTDLWNQFQLYLLTSNYNNDLILRANRFTNYSTQLVNANNQLNTNKLKFINLSTSFNNLRNAVMSAGIDTTSPVLVRNSPSTLTPNITTNSLTLNYSASDPQGMNSTTPLYYSFNGESNISMPSDTDSVITGFTPNTPVPIVVTAKNAANMTSSETLSVTYQTPVISVSSNNYNFGNIKIGSTSALHITISNTGLATGVLGNFTSNDTVHYPIINNTCSSSLTPTSICGFDVNFSPITTGTINAIVSNGTYNISLSGSGITSSLPIVNNTTISGSSDLYGAQHTGQSFTLSQSETITSITVWLTTSYGIGGPLTVYLNNTADLSTYVASGSVNISSSQNGTAVVIPLNTPQNFNSGTWYFALSGPSIYNNRVSLGHTANTYSNGISYGVTTTWPMASSVNSDLYFTIQ